MRGMRRRCDALLRRPDALDPEGSITITWLVLVGLIQWERSPAAALILEEVHLLRYASEPVHLLLLLAIGVNKRWGKPLPRIGTGQWTPLSISSTVSEHSHHLVTVTTHLQR